MQIHPTLRIVIVLLWLALSAGAATNNLDETAASLLSAEERFHAPKEGAVAEPVNGIVTRTPGRSLQERRIEKRTKLDHDDKLATAQSSQALILTPQQAAALGPEGIVRIQRLIGPVTEAIRVEKGKLYFKSIGTPQPEGTIKVLLESGELALAGTEFYVEAATNGSARVLMLDGSARLSNPASTNAGSQDLKPGIRGELASGAAPQVQTVGPVSKQLFNNTVQWCLYYPAVLFEEDLSEGLRQDPLFGDSLRWYQAGALQRAWDSLPPEAAWDTDEKKLYAAALLLALGDVERTQGLLGQIETPASEGAHSEPRPRTIPKTTLTRPEATLSPSDRERGGVRGERGKEGADRPTSPRPSPPVRRAEREESQASDDEVSSASAVPVRADAVLSASERVPRLAAALRQLVAAVKFEENFVPPFPEAQLPTEWLARSYYLQSSVHDPDNIEDALSAAMRSVSVTPQATNFAYGWAQVAALQFSRGHVSEAQLAITTAIQLAPSNAAPYALQGFLQAAQERRAEAEASFKQALELNTKLGDAWLGLGLMAFHNNDPTNGLQRLQIAVVQEPQRSVLRSYLGKGYYEAATYTANPLDSLKQLFTPGDTNRAALIKRADEELKMARLLDPKDPTPDLYSALIKQQENRINEAVRDLEHSKELNDNRRLYRSGLLLDQDQAVRSANLAAIYRDVGLTDWSVREAARAVNSDYANYSAHLFLANSYDALRDPRQVNLRYETPWFNELLLANLLQPVGAGTLSQNISQQEYSRLFEHNQWGISSGTEYLSTGDWSQYASQFGRFDSVAYSLDAVYSSQTGYRPNEDFSQLTLYAKAKQQLTPQDSLLIQGFYYDSDSGDVAQRYDNTQGKTGLRFKERQEPNVLLGYHREWSPQSHTLLVAARLHDRVTRGDTNLSLLFYARPVDDPPNATYYESKERFESELELYSVELEQIWQNPSHTLVAGGRFQTARITTDSGVTPYLGFDLGEIANANTTHLDRQTAYAYHDWHPDERIHLVAGLSYDRLSFPRNIDFAPIADGERATDQLSPKVGLVWTVSTQTWLRAGYTRSLGGVYHDASVRLEPSEVAGFNQAFRSAIPESLEGVVPGSKFETWGISLDHKLTRNTYFGIQGEILKSNADRYEGALDELGNPLQLTRRLEFSEKTLTVSLTQLLGEYWTLGGNYRLSRAELSRPLLEVPADAYTTSQDLDVNASLHQLRLYGLLNTPAGFYAQAESLWNSQSNHGYAGGLPGDDFWQHNFYVGWRFPQRRAELTLGLLNILDQDYRLNPLNLHAELPRERTLLLRVRFNF